MDTPVLYGGRLYPVAIQALSPCTKNLLFMSLSAAFPSRVAPSFCFRFLLSVLVSLFAACGDRQDHSAPAAKPVGTEAARFQIQVASGADLPARHLLPLRISIDNRGSGAAKIIPRQTFLIDLSGQAWSLLTAEQASSRLGRVAMPAPHLPTPESLAALTGFALAIEIAPGHDAAGATWRNPTVPAGQVASGLLFFPSREEIQGVKVLRLCYEQDGQVKCLALSVEGVSAK